MLDNVKEIKNSEVVRPDSFKATLDGNLFKIEYGNYNNSINSVEVNCQITLTREEFEVYLTRLLCLVVEYEAKTGESIVENISRNLERYEE